MNPGRASGVLLHPTSLPGRAGSGDFGTAAYHFVDWLAGAGQGVWQVLPLNPVGPGWSPYMSPSAFAMNPLLVDMDDLVRRGWLEGSEVAAEFEPWALQPEAQERITYGRVAAARMRLLWRAARRFFGDIGLGTPRFADPEFERFREAQQSWLDDYALFMTIDGREGGTEWQRWAAPLARREPIALRELRRIARDDILFWQFVQWVAHRQWSSVRDYANSKGVRVFGDVPIFVAPHSADVWADPELFDLRDDLRPRVVAGVPPDYFSATGQLWGNPLYRWERHRAQEFRWWRRRVASLRAQADLVRIDHFRGFAACWEVPADAPDAIGGRWVSAPGAELFEALRADSGKLGIVAEDLGLITEDVIALRERFGLPGMRVLHFAFDGGPDNAYLPHNFSTDTVVYTGTHDNDTSLGWFAQATAHERRFVQTYLKSSGAEIGWDLIHAASQSVADLSIYPMQDVLGLGTQARMNRPGASNGCWDWRFRWEQVQDWHGRRLREVSAAHGRNGLRLD